MINKKQILAFEPTHPGILIRDELEIREGLTQRKLAQSLGVLPSYLNEIINGKRPISPNFAIKLEKVLDIPAYYWMKFQVQYEIDTIKLQRDSKIKEVAKIEDYSY